MKPQHAQKQFEAVAATIADGMRFALINHYTPGRTLEYEVEYGDEGEGRWTRGKTEITQAHIDAAIRMLGLNGGKP